MSITNYGEIQAAVADYTKRRDLTAQIPDFIRAAHIELQEVVGPLAPLVDDTDTNSLLDYDPFCYLYGALAYASVYLRDDSLATYADLYAKKLTNLALSGLDRLQISPNTVIPRSDRWYRD